MWAILILCLAGLAFAGGRFGFLPPPYFHASVLIRVHRGTIHVSKGRLKPHAWEQVTEILHEAGVASGFIAITANNRVTFSKSIPSTIHQRLRNVLLNQWV